LTDIDSEDDDDDDEDEWLRVIDEYIDSESDIDVD
jgi:hypothetical protein